MKRIAVVTLARSDYAACLSVARLIAADPDLDLYLVVSGMHLSPEFGYTVREIEADRLEISERVEMLLSSDSAEGLAKSLGLGTLGLAQCFARSRPVIAPERGLLHARADPEDGASAGEVIHRRVRERGERRVPHVWVGDEALDLETRRRL